MPELAKLPELATNFLNLAGINIADLEKKPDGAPDFHAWEPFMTYSMNRVTVTNIGFRAINFRRSVAGFRFVGAGAGGDGDLQFGEHGRISKIRLSWRNLERHKSYPTVAPPTIMRWIREGKAVQGKIRMDAPPIDWRTVKSLTVTDAKICYYAGDGFAPSDWLMPFVALWTTVDTGHGKMDVEIDCPIIDTAKPSSPSN